MESSLDGRGHYRGRRKRRGRASLWRTSTSTSTGARTRCYASGSGSGSARGRPERPGDLGRRGGDDENLRIVCRRRVLCSQGGKENNVRTRIILCQFCLMHDSRSSRADSHSGEGGRLCLMLNLVASCVKRVSGGTHLAGHKIAPPRAPIFKARLLRAR